MRKFVSLLSLPALLVAMPQAARSDDAPSTPAERGQAILSALPAPSAKDAFQFEADFYAGGQMLGKVSFGIGAVAADGAPAWRTEDSVSMAQGDEKMTEKSVSTLGPDLHLLRLDKTETQGAATKTTLVVRTEKGLAITKTTPEGKKESTLAADEHTLLGTFTSVLFFLRHCPAEAASYELHAYSDEKGVVEKGALDVKGAGKFTEGETSVDAWVTHAVLGEHTMDVYLDPADRGFLAVRGGEGFLIVKSGLLPKAKPAASGTEAGARMALAILTSDEALLASVLYWPTLTVAAKESEGFEGDEAAYKAKAMADFKTTFKTLERAAASEIVAKAAGGAKEEVVGDVTVVTFGEPMAALVYTAKKIEGAWMIVKLSR